MNITVSEKDLAVFEKDLWKDARKMSVGESEGKPVIRRYSDCKIPISSEIRFIQNLRERVSFKIPEILDHTQDYIAFEYIPGTRAYNLLMDLYHLSRDEDKPVYKHIGLKLKDILVRDLEEFQQLYKKGSERDSRSQVYPATDKVITLYSLLCSVLTLDPVTEDLEPVCDLYEQKSLLPFRDATPKNTILNIPRLFQGQFRTYQDRMESVKLMVKSGELVESIDSDKVFHIDFTGCYHLCPESDDWFALHHHESSNWLQDVPDFDVNDLALEDLCTLFVRFSRFGGRKLAYRLLNKSGHYIRFGLDNESYYFHKLGEISVLLAERGLVKDNKIADLMLKLKAASQIVPQQDYFHDWKKRNRPYYRDVFPN